MKGTITSLVLLALELTLCLISSHWRSIDVNDSEICFKNIFTQFNTSPTEHQYLHVGPIFSSRITKVDNFPEHFTSDHARMETGLLITGIVLIAISAITLSSVEFCSNKSFINRYRIWLHLLNVILLTMSLIILIVGFYLLQHTLKQPLNGAGAIGFFVGILFIVMLGTHSAIKFWGNYHDKYETHQVVKVIIGMNPQWEIVRGKVLSSTNAYDIFNGDEILEVSIVDASRMDVASILLGRKKIPLQSQQYFPIRFQFYYDKSRAGRGFSGLTMQARITNSNGQLLYINDTHTPLTNNVKIDVKRI
ncbi:unnamed protein product [Adineta steineri]|uniref:Uncharacterized protein n=1 Tax=Adineta steineri TaxID=433720 RepID=A0A815QIQ3_9BILA|nr:unnamed protein product [Adineta steineri]CAF1463821.1 unnamed protein product [Adineta steineri]